MNESQRNMFVILKLRKERVADQEKTDKELEVQMVMDRKIETKSVQEGLKLVFRQKLFAVECQKEGQSDQYARMVAVDKEISSCMSQNFEKQKRDEEEEL